MSILKPLAITFMFFAFNYVVYGSTEYKYKPDELLVYFAPKTKGEQIKFSEKANILQKANCGRIKYSYKIIPGLTLVKLPGGLSVQDASNKLKKQKGIISTGPNYIVRALEIPNDELFSQLWGLHNTGQEHPFGPSP